jgi:hypothetical protein
MKTPFVSTHAFTIPTDLAIRAGNIETIDGTWRKHLQIMLANISVFHAHPSRVLSFSSATVLHLQQSTLDG